MILGRMLSGWALKYASGMAEGLEVGEEFPNVPWFGDGTCRK